MNKENLFTFKEYKSINKDKNTIDYMSFLFYLNHIPIDLAQSFNKLYNPEFIVIDDRLYNKEIFDQEIYYKYLKEETSPDSMQYFLNLIEITELFGGQDISNETAFEIANSIVYLWNLKISDKNLDKFGKARVVYDEEYDEIFVTIDLKDNQSSKYSSNTTLKEQIENKIDTVLRQYDSEGGWWESRPLKEHPYSTSLKEIREQLFSNNIKDKQEGLKRLESLLLSLRAWDNYFHYAFDYGDKYKDKFIDDFNNWNEWYAFLESIVSDAKEYLKQENIDIDI